MDIDNEFQVLLPIDEAWNTLTDLERIAPCMPGASLTGRDGEDYLGTVRIKVGPITSQYAGAARFLSQDRQARQAVIEAEGRDTKSAGTAKAVIHAHLRGDAAATTVSIRTELAITGKIAQFGRGAITDVSGRLIDQFVENLSSELQSEATAGAESVAAPPEGTREGSDVVDIGALVLPRERRAAAAAVAALTVMIFIWRARSSG